jgi:hypothetical protein
VVLDHPERWEPVMSSKKFAARVFKWLHQVNEDAELPKSTGKIAIYLSGRFNEKED